MKSLILLVCLWLSFAAQAAQYGGNTYTIRVSSVSPCLTLKIWDWSAEDHDKVKIVVDGQVWREFEIKHKAQTISVPIAFADADESIVEIIGTDDGTTGLPVVSYAVQASGLGTSTEVYKHETGVGTGNRYRIIKTKDDIYTQGWNWLTGREDTNVPECNSGDEEGAENKTDVPWDLLNKSVSLEYEEMEIELPNGGTIWFPGGIVNVDVVDMGSWWGKFENGFGAVADNAGAFASKEDHWFPWFLSNNVYIKSDTTMPELKHEGIHILVKKDQFLKKYKGTKNEEFLAYIISGTGGKTPQEIKAHIDKDPVYESKQWVEW